MLLPATTMPNAQKFWIGTGDSFAYLGRIQAWHPGAVSLELVFPTCSRTDQTEVLREVLVFLQKIEHALTQRCQKLQRSVWIS